MKYLLFIFTLMCVLVACSSGVTNETSNASNDKNTSNEIVKIDELSGYSRDDLLKVFINEIKNPIDSVFIICLKQITTLDNTSDKNTLYSDEAKINETIKFIEYKIDKFEKFKSYQMDSSTKNKMLDYLKIYLNLLRQDYKEIIIYKYKSTNLAENERHTYLDCLSVIDEKIFAAESLLEEIRFEYSNLHNKA